MSDTVIKVENLSKQYRLGTVGLGSLSHDLNRWYQTTLRGKEDPYLKIGETNDRSVKGISEYVWALRDINFEVKQGKVLGIIGRNGAGKSTLLKILSRTTSPTTGQIKIKGRVASLLEVGTGFHPELTGRENIYLNGAILGMTKQEIKSKFDEIVDFSGVERYIDTPVKRYSSGMYVRLAFAVAAHLEPEILIVDEVLAVGDAEFQKKALGKMKDVSGKDGRTVLFVSHNMGAIGNLCNIIIVMNSGKLAFTGEAQSGLNFYLKSLTQMGDYENQKNKLIEKNDDVFQLIDFELSQKDTEGYEFVSTKKIRISFKYLIKKNVSGLRIGFDLIWKNSETVLFRSFHDDSNLEIKNFSPGTYNSILFIDENFLKQGTYVINLAIGIHNVRWIIRDEIRVEFNINNINGINKIYSDNRPGFIMPKVSWETTEIN